MHSALNYPHRWWLESSASSNLNATSVEVFRPWIPRRHYSRNSAPRPKVPNNFRPHRISRLHHIVQNLVYDVLLKNPQVPVHEQILLQALQFHALLARHVADRDPAEVGQAGLGAHTGKLRVVYKDLVGGKLVLPSLNGRKLCI